MLTQSYVDADVNLKDASSESVVGTQLSLESINFKEITNNSCEKIRSRLPVVQSDADKCVSVNMDNSSAVEMSIQKEPVDVASDLDTEVLHNMKSLHTLQKKQKELDMWYMDMQQQLRLEQFRLKARYEELKLKNIREQERIIDTSQEVLRHSVQQDVNILTEDHSSSCLSDLAEETTPERNCGQKQKVKRTLPSPPVQCYEVNTGSSPQQVTQFTTDTLGDTNTERNIHSVPLDNVSALQKLHDRRKSRPIKFFNTPISDKRKSPICFNFASETKTTSSSAVTENGDSFKATSSSTPHGLVVQRQLLHEFSPVYTNTSAGDFEEDISTSSKQVVGF